MNLRSRSARGRMAVSEVLMDAPQDLRAGAQRRIDALLKGLCTCTEGAGAPRENLYVGNTRT